MSKRNPAIELYRIFLMFCICYLHTFCQGPYRNAWQSSLLSFAVPGFMFISGWFGIRFSSSKALRLVCVAVFSALVVPLIGGASTAEYWGEVIRIWHPDGGFWFLWAYLIVMAFAGLVEPLFDLYKPMAKMGLLVRKTLPLFVVVFVWGWMSNAQHLQFLVPKSPGLTPLSFLTLIAIYVFARVCRIGHLDERISTMHASIATVLCFSFIAIVGSIIGVANCFVPVLLSFYLFVLFSRMRIKNAVIVRIVEGISPLMFFVFCLNGTLYLPGMERKFFALINAIKMSVVQMGYGVQFAYLASAVSIFCICVLVVLPWVFVRGRMSWLLNRVDEVADKVIAILETYFNGGGVISDGKKYKGKSVNVRHGV